MRSRSSRLFVVLLHLVGVSTNFPRNPFLAAFYPDKLQSGVGIVGVHPLSILLEPLELQAAGGLEELLSLLESAGYDVEKTVLGEPYWLQDEIDGKCLSPDGFSECGDATLWKIRRRRIIDTQKTITKDKNSKVSIQLKQKSTTSWFLTIFGWRDELHPSKLSDDQTTWEYALELVDVNSSPPFKEHNEHELNSVSEGECVLSLPSRQTKRLGNLEMGSCSNDKAWSWSINEGGVLKWEEKTKSRLRRNGRNDELVKTMFGGPFTRTTQIMSSDEHNEPHQIISHRQQSTQCLWRYDETSARTEPCDASTNNSKDSINRRLVGLSVIQYQNSAAVSPKLPRFIDGKVQSEGEKNINQGNDKTESHLPHSKIHSTSRSNSDSFHHQKVPVGVGGYFERYQLKSNSGQQPTRVRPIMGLSPVGVGGFYESKLGLGETKPQSRINILHHPSSSPLSSPQDAPIKPRKIPVHPYIAASKDGIYVDPNTGLSFPTDIHDYLGHDRRESGRHTLMGVGLFTKTIMKIKIYSVGFYVPKRDVLADSNFAPFADMSIEELRSNDSFYHTLLNEGTVDKTLFIKLNMQLATETVRQSLSAEWQLLSDEHKNELAASSAKERHAEEKMLQTIQSEENSSNCSCGQIAPPEYEADESCCARGTEMVFTWRKNGNLELRIDGRVMDTFTDPIIGKGIFFEYLRGDNPMSMDARDHFVDGFPFLLAPLAQVKGLSSSVPNNQDSSSQTKDSRDQRLPLIKVWEIADDVMNNVSSRVHDVSGFIQGNINGGINNVGNAINSLSKSTRYIGSNLERMRKELLDQLSSEQLMNQFTPEQIKSNIFMWQDQSTRFLVSRFPFLKKHAKFQSEPELLREVEIEPKTQKRKRDVFGHHLAKMLEEISSKRPLSDEIGVIIEPTMSSTHMMFLYMVHFYLVLLLIVSVPDSNSNRLVKMRRSSVSTVDSESDHEERVTELEGISLSCDVSCWDQETDDKGGHIPEFVVESNGHGRLSSMKKSLSYYL